MSIRSITVKLLNRTEVEVLEKDIRKKPGILICKIQGKKRIFAEWFVTNYGDL